MHLKIIPLALAVALFLLSPLPGGGSEAKPVYIGLDAEFGRPTNTASAAIRQGILIAIDEINGAGGVLGGRKLALIEKDNRSVPARAQQNTEEFGESLDVVAMFCSQFSTVIGETIATVHHYGLPLLDPWAAADKIVDNGYTPNYVFRLSLRDSWAMSLIMQTARARGFKKIGVLAPNVSWGRGNYEVINKLAPDENIDIVDWQWFNSGDTTFIDKYLQLKKAGAQAIILIITETEGAAFVNEVAALPQSERLPILNHWGITGSDFAALAGPALYEVDFSVVQTFSFIDAKGDAAVRVLAGAHRLFAKKTSAEIVSPVGLAHAYDLTHILARAIEQAGSTERNAVRDALEKVKNYQGLIKFYRQPFTSTRHEALDPGDVFMARYDRDGSLVRIK